MSKHDEKQARADIKSNQGRLQDQQQNFLNEKSGEYGSASALDKQQRSDIYGGYGNFAVTGGFTPDEQAALAGYKNFADTGGIDAATAGKIRTRASLTPTGYYQSLQDQLQRRARASGGQVTGLGASMARLGRQGAQAGAEATLNADLGIEQQRREGRLAGLTGETNLLQQRRAGQLAGLAGQLGVNTSVGGETSRLDANRLAAMGLDAGTTAQLLGLQSQLATRPGPFQNIMQGISQVGGAAGGILTGIGSL